MLQGLGSTFIHSSSTEVCAVAGIEDLPAELLGVIFAKTLDILLDNDDDNDDDIGQFKVPPCLYLSHVCQNWRNVALSCQELWARILPMPSVKWTDICLSRCPSIPIPVTINQESLVSEEYHEAMSHVLFQHDRIESLHLSLMLELDEEGHPSVKTMLFLEAFFGHIMKAKELRALNLDIYPDEGAEILEWTPIDLPKSLFASHPRLSKVKLGNCALPRKDPAHSFTSALRVLDLLHTKAWDTVDSMIECLQAMPMLEIFTYEFWCYTEGEAFDCRPSRIHQPRSVSLSHLRHLNLSGYWLHNLSIFNYIAPPSKCHIYFKSADMDHIDSVAEDIVSWHITACAESLKLHFSAAIAQGAYYSDVEMSSRHVTGNSPCDFNGPLPPASGLLQPDFCLSVPMRASLRLRKAMMSTLVELPIFTKATKLRFEKVLWHHLPDCYQAYTSVRELHVITPRQADAFTSALRANGVTLFPALRRIILEDVDFRRKSSVVRALVEALHSHHAANGQFECLVLQKCPCATEDAVNEIRARLGTHRVEWDHYVDNSILARMIEQQHQLRLEAGEPIHGELLLSPL